MTKTTHGMDALSYFAQGYNVTLTIDKKLYTVGFDPLYESLCLCYKSGIHHSHKGITKTRLERTDWVVYDLPSLITEGAN